MDLLEQILMLEKYKIWYHQLTEHQHLQQLLQYYVHIFLVNYFYEYYQLTRLKLQIQLENQDKNNNQKQNNQDYQGVGIHKFMRPCIQEILDHDSHKYEVSAILTEHDILARCKADEQMKQYKNLQYGTADYWLQWQKFVKQNIQDLVREKGAPLYRFDGRTGLPLRMQYGISEYDKNIKNGRRHSLVDTNLQFQSEQDSNISIQNREMKTRKLSLLNFGTKHEIKNIDNEQKQYSYMYSQYLRRNNIDIQRNKKILENFSLEPVEENVESN